MRQLDARWVQNLLHTNQTVKISPISQQCLNNFKVDSTGFERRLDNIDETLAHRKSQRSLWKSVAQLEKAKSIPSPGKVLGCS